MNEAIITQAVREYIAARFVDDPSTLKDDTMLMQSGIIDSFGMIEILNFLRERFGLTIPEDEIQLDNFQSIQTIISLLKRTLKHD
jgi:acyl carrier protein